MPNFKVLTLTILSCASVLAAPTFERADARCAEAAANLRETVYQTEKSLTTPLNDITISNPYLSHNVEGEPLIYNIGVVVNQGPAQFDSNDNDISVPGTRISYDVSLDPKSCVITSVRRQLGSHAR